MHARAERYQWRISPSRRLIVSVRRFRTSPEHRSKRFPQLVIPLHIGDIKEIAFRLQVQRRRRLRRIVDFRRLSATLPGLLLALGLAGAVAFATQIVQARQLEPPKTFAAVVTAVKPKVNPPAAPHVLPRSEPTHLSIPSVGIDVDLTSVGQASDGSIQMPPLFDWVAGWYNLSPTPGELGPSIIVGHVDTYKGISVFWNLRYVNPGDLITISRADGSTATFKVSALKQFDQNSFPTQDVYGNLNYAGLRLITCGGTFNNSTESYTQNTVVYASLL